MILHKPAAHTVCFVSTFKMQSKTKSKNWIHANWWTEWTSSWGHGSTN